MSIFEILGIAAWLVIGILTALGYVIAEESTPSWKRVIGFVLLGPLVWVWGIIKYLVSRGG